MAEIGSISFTQALSPTYESPSQRRSDTAGRRLTDVTPPKTAQAKTDVPQGNPVEVAAATTIPTYQSSGKPATTGRGGFVNIEA